MRRETPDHYRISLPGAGRTGAFSRIFSDDLLLASFSITVEHLANLTSRIARAFVLVVGLEHAVGLGVRWASLVIESKGVLCT